MNRISSKFCLVLLAATSAAFSYADGLHVGDKAPMLKVDRWMKGTPVATFEEGHVYVVEFWATWCGPCRQAMPHLTELAKKLAGKATFIGVDIWEEQHAKPGENLKAKADEFVKEMGERMDYSVCAGSDDGYMTKSWMQAAGQGGIPCTFVIGKRGEVAWIGHPIEVEGPLTQIIGDTFDQKAFASKMNPQIDRNREASEAGARIVKPVEDAIKAKKYDLALKECEKAMSQGAEQYRFLIAMRKFEVLAQHFPGRAYGEAKKNEDDPLQSWAASEIFAITPGLKSACYQYALAFFKKKYKDQPGNFVAYAHYASVYFQLGQFDKALQAFKVYAEGARAMKLDPVTLAGIDAEQKKYEAAASKHQ